MDQTTQSKLINNEYKRDSLERISILLLLICVTLAFICLTLYTQKINHIDNFFIQRFNQNGALYQSKALSDPDIEESALISWVAKLISEMYSFNFINSREKVVALKNNFSPEGYTAYQNSIIQIINPAQFVANQMILKSNLTNVPIISRTTTINGVYQWQIKVNADVLSYVGNTPNATICEFDIFVRRTNKPNNDFGVEVFQIGLNMRRRI